MNRRSEFAKLIHNSTLTVMPGAYDGFSARMIESIGFPALTAGGYVANGSMYAEADIGQSNMREFADHYARIFGAVDIPVTVDADTGFGGVHMSVAWSGHSRMPALRRLRSVIRPSRTDAATWRARTWFQSMR